MKYKGGKCSNCGHDDIFFQIAMLQMVLDYAKKNHCCYDCAERAVNEGFKQWGK